MDGFAGRARLEWWANASACLEKYDIDIAVTVDADGTWWATARHASALDTARREGWDFLMAMDPSFSVVFPGKDKGGNVVRVFEAEDGTLTLTEAPDGHGSPGITLDHP
ncbi:hypothetical protein [Streptomyces erythrochromogenes]|uniref:hypothetical protein n=1 Tax=Streptomyces erythrochromogenes TaxID=285574 RepID=UPI003686D34C